MLGCWDKYIMLGCWDKYIMLGCWDAGMLGVQIEELRD